MENLFELDLQITKLAGEADMNPEKGNFSALDCTTRVEVNFSALECLTR